MLTHHPPLEHLNKPSAPAYTSGIKWSRLKGSSGPWAHSPRLGRCLISSKLKRLGRCAGFCCSLEAFSCISEGFGPASVNQEVGCWLLHYVLGPGPAPLHLLLLVPRLTDWRRALFLGSWRNIPERIDVMTCLHLHWPCRCLWLVQKIMDEEMSLFRVSPVLYEIKQVTAWMRARPGCHLDFNFIETECWSLFISQRLIVVIQSLAWSRCWSLLRLVGSAQFDSWWPKRTLLFHLQSLTFFLCLFLK